MWPSINAEYTQESFRRRGMGLTWPKWRPSRFVWHNTAAPSLAQWVKSANEDRANGLIPGISRIRSLEQFYRNNKGWSGCPHLVVAPDFIWEMNSLDAKGVHSPSFNNTAIGIEMCADFSVEDDESGDGLRVKQNTIFATAILCSALGLEPTSGEIDHNHNITGTIFLHKQDWATTHDCPGEHIARDKAAMIADVAALMDGGDHNPHDETTPPPAERRGVTTIDGLNFRRGPGVSNESTGMLPKNTAVTILSTAANGADSWLQVRTPAGYTGWVSARYVQITGG